MITDLEISDCLELLGNNYLGHLSYIKDEGPYIVPITYYYDSEEKCILSYSSEGHKIDAMREKTSVAFQVEEITSIGNWRSVQISGKFEELKGNTGTNYLSRFAEGVQDTIGRSTNGKPKFIQDFSHRLQRGSLPIVYRIAITQIIGKSRNFR